MLLKLLILTLFFIVHHTYGANETLNLQRKGACNGTSSVGAGDTCQYELTIILPSTQALYVELFTSDFNSSYLPICRPKIQMGINLKSSTPRVEMIPVASTLGQFDLITIDFGQIVNTNTQPGNTTSNTLTITFNVIIIDMNQTSGSNFYVSVGVDLIQNNETWVAQDTLNYISPPPPPPPPPPITEAMTSSGALINSTNSPQIGKTSWFEYKISIERLRYFQLSATASTTSNQISICSIHVKSADVCFECLNSTKTFLKSNYDQTSNLVRLDVGWITNTGFNNGSVTGKSGITFIVFYRLSDTALVGTSHSIIFTVKIVHPLYSSTHPSTHTVVAFQASKDTNTVPVPLIIANINKTHVSINEPFSIKIDMDVPTAMDHYFQLDVIGDWNTSNEKARMKICGVQVKLTGENVPCDKHCLNTSQAYSYSLQSQTNAFDRFTWTIANLKNHNLRTPSDALDANKLIFNVYGQVVEHVDNVMNANASVFLSLKFGNSPNGSLIYTHEFNFKIGANTSLARGYPLKYNLSIGDLLTSYVDPHTTRQLYFDINTTSLSIYQDLTVQVLMPETQLSYGTAAGSICRIKVHYVGSDVSCLQKDLINNHSNGYITYENTLNRYVRDKASIRLGVVCNTADTFDYNLNSVIRILVYFELYDLPPPFASINYLIAGIDNLLNPLNANETSVYVQQLAFTKTYPINYQLITTILPVVFFEQHKMKSVLRAGEFGEAYVIIKVPPRTKAPYRLEAIVSSALVNGYATLCTFQYTQSGEHVPCTQHLRHNFRYDINYVKVASISDRNILCSVNNITHAFNGQDTWDEDSVRLRVITRVSDDVSSGQYSLHLFLINDHTFTDLNYMTWQWTVNNSLNSTLRPINVTSSFVIIDTNSLNHNLSTNLVYIGQTIILRYKITLHSGTLTNLMLTLTSINLNNDSFSIQKLFISNNGDNLPCTKSQFLEATYMRSNLTKFAYRAQLNIGDLCNYPIDPGNNTANELTIDAYVRIPINSTLVSGSLVDFHMESSYGSLNKTVSGTLQYASSLNANLTNKQVYYGENNNSTYTPSTTNVEIRQLFNYTLKLYMPPFTSVRTSIDLSTLNGLNKFAHIKSIHVKLGKNIDGALSDIESGIIRPNLSSTTGSSFYNDHAFIDFGIITNTLYTYSIGNYVPDDDDLLSIDYTLLVTDDLQSNHDNMSQISIKINLGSSIQSNITAIEPYRIVRDGTEAPLLNITALILNNTNSIYTSGTQINIRLFVEHLNESKAEAQTPVITFYVPNYIIYKQHVSTINSSLVSITNGTQLKFSYPIIYFDQQIVTEFSLVIDPLNERTNLVKLFGQQSIKDQIPYFSESKKTPRLLPFSSNVSIYRSPISFVSISSPEVSFEQMPNDTLLEAHEACQIRSSVYDLRVVGSIRASGFRTGYQSYKYYKSQSIFVEITFARVFKISYLLLRQFLISTTSTPFSKFRVACSLNSQAYSFLPEESFNTYLIQSNEPYDYYIPNGPIACRSLRVYITDIQTPSELSTKTTGLRIEEIYGDVENSQESNNCTPNEINYSTWYSPKSVLYNSFNKTIYVCDETHDRKSSVCFTSTDGEPNRWKELTQSVSTIVFSIIDLEELRYSLYGVSYDKVTLVKSDNNGVTWKSISLNEFNDEMNNGINNLNRYVYSYFNGISLATIPNLFIQNSLWTVNIYGLSYNGQLKYDWFN